MVRESALTDWYTDYLDCHEIVKSNLPFSLFARYYKTQTLKVNYALCLHEHLGVTLNCL